MAASKPGVQTSGSTSVARYLASPMQLDESVVLEKPGAQRIVIVVDGTLAIEVNDTEEDMV